MQNIVNELVEEYTEESQPKIVNPSEPVMVPDYTNGNHTNDTQIPAVISELPEDLKTYTTIHSGVTIRLNAISPLLIGKVQELLKEPLPPRYKIELAGGAEQWHDYDEESIQDEDTSEEDKMAWAFYQAKKQEIASLRNQRMIDLFLGKGIDFELPEDEEWVEMQELVGIKVPENKLQRRIHYIQTEIITSGKDLEEIMARLMALTGVSNRALQEARGLFRLSVQGKARSRLDAEGPTG